MGKSGGFFLTIAAIIMSVIIWGNPITRIINTFAPPPVTALTESSLENTAVDLSVNENQLMAHVEAITQPRATLTQKETARRYITEQLTRYGLSPTQQPYGPSQNPGVNIIVNIPGSNLAAGTIVLGAHYDSIVNSPGADDNGSAIAAALEAARIFSSQAVALQSADANAAPKSLKIVFFDQEEQQPDGSGLLGSLAFTSVASNLADVKGAVILDMIGYACRIPGCQSYPERLPVANVPDTGDFLAVLGLESHTDLLGSFMLSAQSNWPLVLTLPIPKLMLNVFPDLLRSDHAPFWEKGIPAVFVSDTANFRNPNYHTASDTPGTLDRSFFRGSSQHVVNAIAALLNQAES